MRGRSGVYLVKSVHMFLDEGSVKNTSIYRVYDHQLTKFRRAVMQTVMTLSGGRTEREKRRKKVVLYFLWFYGTGVCKSSNTILLKWFSISNKPLLYTPAHSQGRRYRSRSRHQSWPHSKSVSRCQWRCSDKTSRRCSCRWPADPETVHARSPSPAAQTHHDTHCQISEQKNKQTKTDYWVTFP